MYIELWIIYTILWIGYGIHAILMSPYEIRNDAIVGILYIIFAPIVFVIKALYGAFKSYD